VGDTSEEAVRVQYELSDLLFIASVHSRQDKASNGAVSALGNDDRCMLGVEVQSPSQTGPAEPVGEP